MIYSNLEDDLKIEHFYIGAPPGDHLSAQGDDYASLSSSIVPLTGCLANFRISSASGNFRCVPCPTNSSRTAGDVEQDGNTQCTANPGFYLLGSTSEINAISCTELPNAAEVTCNTNNVK